MTTRIALATVLCFIWISPSAGQYVQQGFQQQFYPQQYQPQQYAPQYQQPQLQQQQQFQQQQYQPQQFAPQPVYQQQQQFQQRPVYQQQPQYVPQQQQQQQQYQQRPLPQYQKGRRVILHSTTHAVLDQPHDGGHFGALEKNELGKIRKRSDIPKVKVMAVTGPNVTTIVSDMRLKMVRTTVGPKGETTTTLSTTPTTRITATTRPTKYGLPKTTKRAGAGKSDVSWKLDFPPKVAARSAKTNHLNATNHRKVQTWRRTRPLHPQQQFYRPQPPPQQYQPQAPPPPPQQYQPQQPPQPVYQQQVPQQFPPQQFQQHVPVTQQIPQYQPQAPPQPQPQAQSYAPARQVFREQPTLVQQQVKVAVPPAAPQIFNPPTVSDSRKIYEKAVHAPPPPEKFIPHASDIYNPEEAQIFPAKSGNDKRITVINTDGNLPAVQQQTVVVSSGSEVDASEFEEIPVVAVQKPQPAPVQHFQPAPTQFRQAPHVSQPAPVHVSVPVKKTRKPKPSAAAPARESVLQATMSPVSDGGSKVEEEPNTVFLNCCKKRGVDKKCESRCNFDIMNKKVLTGMFLGTDPCPQAYGRDLLSCAAQDQDHSTCCREKGVHETTAGDKCLGFCNMTPGNSFQADVSMLPCWAVLNDIKNCFKEHIEL